MSEIPDETIQCCVTSPPYWGLRKYDGEQDSIWPQLSFAPGREPIRIDQCAHEWITTAPRRDRHASDIKNLNSKEATNGGNLGIELPSTNTCRLCGAWRGAYGLEPTPGMYVEHTIEILREIRRVLRPDGVVFLNLGDSYASGKGTCFNPGGGSNSLEGHANLKEQSAYPLDRGNKSTLEASNLKPKDLCLIPFRVAIAAQEAGWWVRSVIIWNKPNPMPESVKDRPTDAYEHIIMLTKSARYFWDQEAVREANIWIENRPSGMERQAKQYRERIKHNDPKYGGGGTGFQGHSGNFKADGTPLTNPNGRNLRNVWTFPTQPYAAAHFATFPEALPERCIKAATPEYGCCDKCGKPYERIVKKSGGSIGKGSWVDHSNDKEQGVSRHTGANNSGAAFYDYKTETIGWKQSCKCADSKTVPSIVLDPFAGSGTSLLVAARLNRKSIGYELSKEYCRLIVERNKQGVIL